MAVTARFDRSDTPSVAGRWAVETHGLTQRFGENVALKGVDLPVPRGCWFGDLGPNGAGKTTLLRVWLGLTRRVSSRLGEWQ
jgi:ABC-type multidrug transport system ATPase subunit